MKFHVQTLKGAESHANIPRREEQGVHGDVEPSPAEQRPVPESQGPLSQMLLLLEDWDYTLKGLALINREKIDAIRQAIRELEQAGYIVRSRERDERGRLRGADYVIYEQPQTPPALDLPTLENPTLDNPTQEKPTLENPTQLNKDIQSKDPKITDPSITHSFHQNSYIPDRGRKPVTALRCRHDVVIKIHISPTGDENCLPNLVRCRLAYQNSYIPDRGRKPG